tara:strand:- start:324 stop:446 length:123 start_codon:yes stop_codon:yes gene_type:complete
MGGGTQSTRESKGLGNGQEQSKNWVDPIAVSVWQSIIRHF